MLDSVGRPQAGGSDARNGRVQEKDVGKVEGFEPARVVSYALAVESWERRLVRKSEYESGSSVRYVGVRIERYLAGALAWR